MADMRLLAVVAILLLVGGLFITVSGGFDLGSLSSSIAEKRKVYSCTATFAAADSATQQCFDDTKRNGQIVGAIVGCLGGGYGSTKALGLGSAAKVAGAAVAEKAGTSLLGGPLGVGVVAGSCLLGGGFGYFAGGEAGALYAQLIQCPVSPRIVDLSCDYTGKEQVTCPNQAQFSVLSTKLTAQVTSSPSNDVRGNTFLSFIPLLNAKVDQPVDLDAAIFGDASRTRTFSVCTNDDTLRIRLIDPDTGQGFGSESVRTISLNR